MTRLAPWCIVPAARYPGFPKLLSDFILALPILVFSLVAHEYAHGIAAFRQGDNTAYMLGRLTLNPLPHIDPVMSLLMPALLWFASGGRFTFGGAKPVPVNPRNYRNYKRGDIIVSSAGVATNLVLSVLCALAIVLVGLVGRVMPDAIPALATLQRMMVWGIALNLMLCFFNLIPIPPLDGSHLFYYLLPPAWGIKYRSMERYGFMVLVALLVFFPQVTSTLLAPARWGLMLLLGLVYPYGVGDGWNPFQG